MKTPISELSRGYVFRDCSGNVMRFDHWDKGQRNAVVAVEVATGRVDWYAACAVVEVIDGPIFAAEESARCVGPMSAERDCGKQIVAEYEQWRGEALNALHDFNEHILTQEASR